MEFLSSSTNPLGNFGAGGYSQYGLPVLTQMTAVTGMLGLTFLVSWFPAVVNWAWDNSFDWQRVRAGVIAYAIILLVVVGYGAVRLVDRPGDWLSGHSSGRFLHHDRNPHGRIEQTA